MSYKVKKWQVANADRDRRYKDKMLQRVSEKELQEWLRRNPPDDIWEEGQYAWAYTEMPIGKMHTWWRRKVLGWSI